jgi:hypothetical protein
MTSGYFLSVPIRGYLFMSLAGFPNSRNSLLGSYWQGICPEGCLYFISRLPGHQGHFDSAGDGEGSQSNPCLDSGLSCPSA